MVFFNYALRKLNAKIVYYGPGLCGKTTNLQWIHDHFEGGKKGNMLSLATEGDRTIFFDLLPLDIGTIRGMEVTLQLYTVPGQVHYNSTRQLVLRGADGVVFVADSQRAMLGSNRDSWKNLKENLLLQGVELASFPHVLQFNKRDLGDIVSVERLDEELNEYSAPIFEAVATQGIGVQETLEGIVKLVMRSLRERYEAEFAHPAAPAGFTAPSVAPAAPAPPAAPAAPPEAPPAQPPAWPVPQPAGPAAAPPAGEERGASTAPLDYGNSPEAETHPGIAELSITSEQQEEEEKEPTLVIAPEDTGLPVPEVGEVELDEGALETADLVEEPSPLEVELPEGEPPALDVAPEEDVSPPVELEEVPQAAPVVPPREEPAAEEPVPEGSPDEEESRPLQQVTEEVPVVDLPGAVEEPAGTGSPEPAAEEVPATEYPGEAEQAPPPPEPGEGTGVVEPELLAEPGGATPTAEVEPREEVGAPGGHVPAGGDTGAGAPRAMDEAAGVEGVPDAFGGGFPGEEAGPGEEPVFGPGDDEGMPPGAPEQGGEPAQEPGAPEAVPEPAVGPEEPAPPVEEPPTPAVEPFDMPAEAETGSPELGEDLFAVDEAAPEGPPLGEEGVAEEPEVPRPEPVAEPFGAPPPVWDGDPFELPEETGPAGESRVLAPVEARAVRGPGGGNQLRLSLEGTGALAEYGQVRELDIVVPVPGDWIGGQKVTLQFRLTLVPEGEAE